MFTTIIVQPIFNLLVLIYAVLPGHNFGLALIIFTILVRLLMWPLVKKQLKQAKAMRELQPEIKKIKKAAKGNRQKESLLLMELYKEREVSPFGSIGTLIVQLIILIGLYSGLRKVVYDPHQIVTFSYPALQKLSWLKELGGNIHKFHSTLFGLVDLSRSALSKKGIYWPAMVIVVGSALTQYFQTKQLMPSTKESKSLRAILKSAGDGKQADQAEVNAAVGRGTRYFLPFMVFLFTVNYPSALSLYWLVGGLAAFVQQSIVFREDTAQLENQASSKLPTKNVADIAEAEVVEPEKDLTKKPKPQSTHKSRNKKRRKK
jgi:YidC/Oxa1 family membrane protein insertase